ncbi:MAG: hypothetical protein ACLS48_10975 [[Eubacterium] siraeum]
MGGLESGFGITVFNRMQKPYVMQVEHKFLYRIIYYLFIATKTGKQIVIAFACKKVAFSQ